MDDSCRFWLPPRVKINNLTKQFMKIYLNSNFHLGMFGKKCTVNMNFIKKFTAYGKVMSEGQFILGKGF